MRVRARLPIYIFTVLTLAFLLRGAALADGGVSDGGISRETSADVLELRGEGTVYVNAGHIGALLIGEDAPDAVRICGGVEDVELSGSGRTVTVAGHVRSVTVSGEGCTLLVPWGGAAERIELTKDSRDCRVEVSTAPVEALALDGSGNSAKLGGRVGTVSLAGTECSVTGKGSVGTLTRLTYRSECSLPADSVDEKLPTGLEDLSIDVKTKDSIVPGEAVTASAELTNPFEVDCRISWYVNSALVERKDVTVGPEGARLELDHELVYDETVTEQSSVRIVAVAKNASGVTESASKRVEFEIGSMGAVMGGMDIKLADAGSSRGHVRVSAKLKNDVPTTCLAVWTVDGRAVKSHSVTVGPEGAYLTLDRALDTVPETGVSRVGLKLTRGRFSAARVLDVKTGVTAEEALATVTSKYAGDRTLEWALSHDYDDNMKTAFVNAKGYESATDRLIWVNLTYQRVNVFTGSKGHWTLEKTFLCGTGAPSSGTPVGEYTVWYKQPNGWNHGSYIVRPVVRFNVGSGYAFHSRLWDPTHTRLIDARIGFPISAGCVRMYDEDAQWMLDNILENTKVVVH